MAPSLLQPSWTSRDLTSPLPPIIINGVVLRYPVVDTAPRTVLSPPRSGLSGLRPRSCTRWMARPEKACGTPGRRLRRLRIAADFPAAQANYIRKLTTKQFMHSVFRWSTKFMYSLICSLRGATKLAAFTLRVSTVCAQMPEGSGREETQNIYSGCHELVVCVKQNVDYREFCGRA